MDRKAITCHRYALTDAQATGNKRYPFVTPADTHIRQTAVMTWTYTHTHWSVANSVVNPNGTHFVQWVTSCSCVADACHLFT